MASYLKDKVTDANNIEVRLANQDEVDRLARAEADRHPNGVFVNNVIYISNESYKPDTVLLHEIIHAFVFNAKKSDAKLKQLQRIFEDAVISLETKHKMSREDLIQKGIEYTDKKSGNTRNIKFYGLTNLDEFLAEAFANGDFMRELAELDENLEKKVKWFDRFTNWVISVLGIKNTSDIFDRTKRFLEDMLTNQFSVTEQDTVQLRQSYETYQDEYYKSPRYYEDLVYDKHIRLMYDNLSNDRIEYLQEKNISEYDYNRISDEDKENIFMCMH